MKLYTLPPLPYGYNGLAPYLSQEQLTLHHDKHHQAYIDGANAIYEKKPGTKKEKLSFFLGGHILHSLLWENLMPAKDFLEIKGPIKEAIEKEFGNFDNFKTEFTQMASTIEGSGWAALAYEKEAEKLILLQIEKHNVNLAPNVTILLVLDMWEHAYYLDYKNEKAKYIEGFWSVVNWEKVQERFAAVTV